MAMTYPTCNTSTLAVVHSDAYAGWVFSDTHPTQGRRFLNARDRLMELAPAAGVAAVEVESDLLPALSVLEKVHDRDYIEQVVLAGECGEWAGSRPDLGQLALRMVGGTLLAAQLLLDGMAHTAVHFAGAKHHAKRDHSSGFCVFNDLAVTAKHLLDMGATYNSPYTGRRTRVDRIAILDIDAHHGDGTEELLQADMRVQTFSVHDRTIFPGTGHDDDWDSHVFNVPLVAGSGDEELMDAVGFFTAVADAFRPDLIFIAMGADGYDDDPLSSLRYSLEGMERAVRYVRRAFRTTPILLGGAGGYLPDTVTPEAWARMAVAAAQPVEDHDQACAFLVDSPYEPHPREEAC